MPKTDATRRLRTPIVEIDDDDVTLALESLPDATTRQAPPYESRRAGSRGGTLMARLGRTSFPTPVALRHLSGQFEIPTEVREVEGRYVLGQELGRGGMGVVRLVKDLDVGREVAMKLLHPDDPDKASLVDALIVEAQTTGQLEHPSIIPLYELGVLPSGDVFYTMKAVSGSTLRDVVKRLRDDDPKTCAEYTQRRLLTIFGQICLAMHYAHSRGVVHRDLKPDNVLLGSFGEVLVMDWGIAYVIGKGRGGALAEPGMVVGTPHYMSPEQASGQIDRVDGRSDIYSLGVMLYELLTLETPVTDPNTERVLSVLRRFEPPKRPVSTDPKRPIPDELAEICVRLMAADPRDRYPNGRVVFEAVEGYLEGSAERDRRMKMAQEELAVGVQALTRFRELKNVRERLGHRIDERETEVHRWDAQAVKRDLWELKARFNHMELVVSQAFSEAANHFLRVLGLVPGHSQARAGLAKLYDTRLEAAEKEADHASLVYFGDLVLRYNDADHGGPLSRGDGHVTVGSFPEGADIKLYDFTQGIPDTRMGGGIVLGTAPVSADLPMGLYLLVAHKDGYRDAQQPIFVRPGRSKSYLLSLRGWAAEEQLVGRDGELSLLRFNYERAVAGRQIRRVLVTGTDGIGKNRLLHAFDEFLDGLPDAAFFFFAECHEQHVLVPYAAVTECLRIRAGVEPGDWADTVRKKLQIVLEAAFRRAGPIPPEMATRIATCAETLARLPGLATADLPPDRPPAEMRARFDRALVEFLDLMTSHQPCIFVFQEVEYLDDATARAIAMAHEFLTDSPVMILALGADVGGQRGWDERIRLGPLGETAVDAFLRDLLKGPLPPGLGDYVMARSGGIPWLVVDSVRRLAESYDLYSTDGRWVLKDGIEPAHRTTMLEARAAMVSELPVELAEALRAAAVIGDLFWVEALTAIGVADAERLCAELTEREIIRETPRSRYPGTKAFAFRSLLFRELVYDTIDDEADVKRLHLGVADWIRQRFQSDLREVAELARHVELAHDEVWAGLLFAQLGDVCRDNGCFGMARECYLRALTNTVEAQDRQVLEERMATVKGDGPRD